MTERTRKKPRTAWEPGYCPNPRGRPKGSTNKSKKKIGEAELKKILKELTSVFPEAVAAVKDMLTTSEKKEDKYKAGIWVIQQIVSVQKELAKKGEASFSEEADDEEDYIPAEEEEGTPLATLSLTAPDSVN